MKARFYLLLSLFTWCMSGTFAQLMPVAVTRFNEYVIADGSADAAVSINVTNGFDQAGWAFVAQIFNGTTTRTLPMSRVVNSAITTGLTCSLADYSGNNAFYLTANNTPATLNFASFQSANTLYILGTTISGSSVADITVTFNDATSQVFTINNFP